MADGPGCTGMGALRCCGNAFRLPGRALGIPHESGAQPAAAHPLGEDVLKDIARINAIWTEGAGRGGPFLCGPGMGNVDAMFAPVVCRFLSYDVPGLSPTAHAYMQAVRHHPLMEEWYAAAAREPVAWQLDMYEALA